MVLDSIATNRLERLARTAEVYVAQVFGVNLGLQDLTAEGLPYFLTDRYHFWRGDLQGRPAVFMANRSGPLDTADIAKHRDLAMTTTPTGCIGRSIRPAARRDCTSASRSAGCRSRTSTTMSC